MILLGGGTVVGEFEGAGLTQAAVMETLFKVST
jgi:hypothetical protein